MAKMRMDFNVNIQLRNGSKYFDRKEPVKSVGVRNTTLYLNGDPTKVVSQNDVAGVYVIKDGCYKKVDIDTFVALYRMMRR